MRAARRCREDELAGAARARDPRIALAHIEQRQAARGGHLDDGGDAVAEHTPLRIDLATEWVAHMRDAKRAFRRANERAHRSLAAIGERHLLDERIGPHAPDATRDRRCNGDRIRGAFERLGSDDHPMMGFGGHAGIHKRSLCSDDPHHV